MNQQDQINSQNDPTSMTAYPELGDETLEANQRDREWLPEDDDDWYEPECCRNDRKGS